MAFCFLANQILAREGWARERLEAFRGECFELALPLLPVLRLSIGVDGKIIEGGTDPAALVSLAGVAGSSALADELRYLAKHLRPDVAEELSKVVGDVAAQRIVAGARGFIRWQGDAAQRIAEALAAYAAEERGMLLRRAALTDFASRVRHLEERLERLSERVGRLA